MDCDANIDSGVKKLTAKSSALIWENIFIAMASLTVTDIGTLATDVDFGTFSFVDEVIFNIGELPSESNIDFEVSKPTSNVIVAVGEGAFIAVSSFTVIDIVSEGNAPDFEICSFVGEDTVDTGALVADIHIGSGIS